VLHALTSAKGYQLYIELESWENETAYATYANFSVSDEDSNYTLSLSGYTGNAGMNFIFSNVLVKFIYICYPLLTRIRPT